MAWLLKIPLYDDEILPSFLSRFAHANGRTTYMFYRDLGLDYLGLVHGDSAYLSRIADLCGVEPDKLRHHAFVADAQHRVKFLGETFGRKFVTRISLRFCPDCFRDDDADNQRMPNTRRYIRGVWLLNDVATCARHSRAIIEIKPPSSHRQVGVYEILERKADEVSAAAETSPTRPPTLLDQFAHDRFHGVAGYGEILDNLPLAVALDFSRQLGVALVHGKTQFVTNLPRDQQSAAMLIGFGVLSEGRTALDAALSALHGQGGKPGRNLRSAYGRIYHSVIQGRGAAEYDVIRSWIDEHANKHVLVSALKTRLGVAEDSDMRPQSLASVARATGVSKFAIRRRLGEAGLTLNSDPKAVQDALAELVDRGAGKPIRATEAAEILGCRGILFAQLVAAGLVPRLELNSPANANLSGGKRTRYFSRAEVEQVRDAILACVNTTATSEMLTLRRAAAVTGVAKVRLLSSILTGAYRSVAASGAPSLEDNLMLNPKEVLHSPLDDTHVSVKDAAFLLDISRTAVSKLTARGVLSYVDRLMSRGLTEHMIPKNEITSFKKRYITIGQLAKNTGLDKNTLVAKAKARNVMPAFPRQDYGVFLIRREDVGHLFG